METKEMIEILMVEDSDYDAEMALISLKESNISNKIHWVKDGEEALDFLFGRGEYSNRNISNTPKLVLLDLKMPKIDGLQVLKEMRSNDSTKRIPVVMMTSSKEEQDIIRSYELGVNSYIVKPVEFDKFSKAVADIGFYWMLLNVPKP